MITDTFQGETVYILNDPPNWNSGFKTDFTLMTDLQMGLTHIESRRPYSMFLRLSSLKFTCTVYDQALITLQAQLRNLTSERVAVPFWPSLDYWANRLSIGIGGGLQIVYKPDWSQWAIFEAGDEPAWPNPGDYWAPLVLGYFKANGSAPISPTVAAWAFEFVESSKPQHALVTSPDFSVAIDGPRPIGYTAAPAILPFIPDWSNVEESILVDVKREQIGFERPAESTFYPHDPYRVNNSDYTLHGERVGALIQFFVERAGQGASFWALSSLVAAQVVAPALSSDTTISVIDASALRVADFVAYITDSGVYFAKVSSIVGTNVSLSAALGVALPVNGPLYTLCLARLDKPKLSLTWTSQSVIKVKIQWQEVRVEKAIPASETLATTIGQLPMRVALFQFTRDYGNGATQNWYFTSAEVDINYNGQLWLSKPFQAGDITSTLNMENDAARFTTFTFTGNPLNDEAALTAETPLTCVITFADFNNGDLVNAQTVFTGDCTTTQRDGSKIQVSGRFGSSLFETELPRFVRGVMCNHIGGSNNDGSFLISAGCTLLKTDWKFTATVDNVISSAFPYTLVLASLTPVGASAAAATLFANWFSNGWIEWGTGVNTQRRLIIGSTNPVAGACTLTLHRYFQSLPGHGDAVTLYPGCDGLYPTCKAYNALTNSTGKFNNKPNFGGEPFTPIANPSANGLPSLNTQGSKK